MTTPARIVVVDDHHMFRAGVIELLQSVPEFEIVGDGASGVEAITMAREFRPDVVILDVEMPGPGATTTIRRILEASPTTKVVVLTMHDDAELVRTLFDAGAVGYLLKSAGRHELVAAISTASRSEGSVLLAVSRSTVMNLGSGANYEALGLLSERENQVLQLLAKASSNQEIAAALFISAGTVKRHLANIYAKLGATSRMDAVRKATQLGILTDTFAADQPTPP